MKDLLENDNYLELTVGKIVARDYRKALVLGRMGLTFVVEEISLLRKHVRRLVLICQLY